MKRLISLSLVVLLFGTLASCANLVDGGMIEPGEKVGEMVLTTSHEENWIPFFIDICIPDPASISKDCGEIQVVPSLLIGLGLSENDKATLDSEWLKTSGWELFFDEQPVNLPAFGTIDFEREGQVIRVWNVVVNYVTPGSHTIRYNMDYEKHFEMAFTFSVLYTDPVLTARKDIAHGRLSANFLISSGILGYDINYRVYTPAGVETMENMPVIYVTDGQNYSNPTLGAMVNVLDNLIADQKIKPLIAVFIDARDPASGVNRRESELDPISKIECPFCDFIASELVPMIDESYKTDASPDARAMLGFSLGGHFTSYVGLAYSDLFHLIAIQSPSYLSHQWIYTEYENAERLPIKVFLSHGTEEHNDGAPQLRDILQAKGYPLLYLESPGGHTYGMVRGVLDDMLIYFFGKEAIQ